MLSRIAMALWIRKYFRFLVYLVFYSFICILCNVVRFSHVLSTSSHDTSRDGDVSLDTSNLLMDNDGTNASSSNGENGDDDDVNLHCPSNVICSHLGPECVDCDFNRSCVYGLNDTVDCHAKNGVFCLGENSFKRTYNCRYCYQLDPALYHCNHSVNCSVTNGPRSRYQAACEVNPSTLCMGKRKFYKMRLCNWTSGYRWSTALTLSITLGGFGADRFYLGLWKEGIGKLFSFGGLGVWTIVDVILIAIGYITPADGSLYL